MSAHRYWRIEYTACPDRPAAAEIEMRTSPGGADQCSGGTASASSYSYFGSGDPSYAFDNNTGTRWLSNFGGSPEWIQYDFGSGNDKDIVEISIRAEDGTWANAPTAGRVKYSDDGSTFTEAWTFSCPGWRGNGTSQTFGSYSIPTGSYRFIRARTTDATGSDAVKCAELSIRTAPGGANSFSSADSGDRFWSDMGESTPSLGAPTAFDGDTGTYFSASGANQVGSLYAWKDGFEYLSPVEFAWTAWASASTGQPEGTLYFEGSNNPYFDGWDEILAVTPGAWSAGQTQTFSVMVEHSGAAVFAGAGALLAAASVLAPVDVDGGAIVISGAGTLLAAGALAEPDVVAGVALVISGAGTLAAAGAASLPSDVFGAVLFAGAGTMTIAWPCMPCPPWEDLAVPAPTWWRQYGCCACAEAA